MNFTACILHLILLGRSRRDMWHAWGRRKVFTGFWLEGPKGRDHWEDRRRWKDNIKLGLREIGIDGANWIQLAQDRVQWRAFNTVKNLRVP
jgi:hypothetical protein